ncbi:MAG: serine/threonine protein kinase [Pseudomonadota bacterium]
MPLDPPEFTPETILKRDAFSETVLGHTTGAPAQKVVRRRLDVLALPGRWVGRYLAAREARALAAAAGIDGVPPLLAFDRSGLMRGWTHGTPLHLAKPAGPEFYRDAKALLRALRRRGVTHNDLAKPQNWLADEAGRPALIDFQLAAVTARKGRLFRVQAYEDLRHLLKQKRRYAPAHLTPTERRIVERRSLPSRIWRQTGKRAYTFVTRRLFDWSDREGAGERLVKEGPAIQRTLEAVDGVRAAALTSYPRASGGQGLYAFVETEGDEAELRAALAGQKVDLIQTVPALPRGADGAVDQALLALVAGNRIDEVEAALSRDPSKAKAFAPVLAGRKNLTDRL